MSGIYAKPVTCSKGLKVPFAVTGHIYYIIYIYEIPDLDAIVSWHEALISGYSGFTRNQNNSDLSTAICV